MSRRIYKLKFEGESGTHRMCRKCDTLKPLTDYYGRNPDSPYPSQRYQYTCKACNGAIHRHYEREKKKRLGSMREKYKTVTNEGVLPGGVT